MSLKNTRTNFLIAGWNASFMSTWKVEALVKPKRHHQVFILLLMCLECCLWIVFAAHPDLKIPWLRTILVKMIATSIPSSNFSIQGLGIYRIRLLYLTLCNQHRSANCLFLTSSTKLKNGLVLNWIIPIANISFTNHAISFFSTCGYRKAEQK